MSSEKVVYEAKPGRFIVQERTEGGWEDKDSYEWLEGAQQEADSLALMNVREYRVVERSYDDRNN